MSKHFNIVLPTNPYEFLELNEKILEKNDSDGVNSPLNNQLNLDIADWQAKYDFALAKHEEGVQLAKDREDAIEQRNEALGLKDDQNAFTEGTVLFIVCQIRDDLASVYRGSERRLGLWGYVVDNRSGKKPKIIIPRSPDRLARLANRIVKKHEADGVDSILDTDTVDALKSLVEYADEQFKLANDIESIRKSVVEERNNAFGRGKKQSSTTKGTMLYYVCSARDKLLGSFRSNVMQLALWGYTVQYTSQSPTPPGPDPDPTAAEVSGKVLNAITQMGVGEVAVEFLTAAGVVDVTTDPLGNYAIIVPVSEAELITVQINHAGYQPFTEQHMLTPGDELVFDFNLQPL